GPIGCSDTRESRSATTSTPRTSVLPPSPTPTLRARARSTTSEADARTRGRVHRRGASRRPHLLHLGPRPPAGGLPELGGQGHAGRDPPRACRRPVRKVL